MPENWRRVGAQIRTARARAGHTPRSFAAAVGISERTLWDLETGARHNFRQQTLDRVEAELGWAEGSIARIAAGRREIRNQDAQLRLTDLWPSLDAGARVILLELAERAARESRRNPQGT